jgi:hypothetical protein
LEQSLNIDKIIADASAIAAEAWQMELVDSVMSAAQKYATENKIPLGKCFAAAFDLIVAAHYYGNVANRGWLYCGPKSPILLYPYTNTCPRCALRNEFHFHKANKPRSGNIGSVASIYLCLCYKWYFDHSENRNLEIFIGREPVDVLLLDRKRNACLLAEIKASPLVVFPLAVEADRLTEETDAGLRSTKGHEEVTIPTLNDVGLCMLLPTDRGAPSIVKLGRRKDDRDFCWAAQSISRLCRSAAFFDSYFQAWVDAFRKYAGEIPQSGTYWLTNSCGSPNPMPTTWPKRSGGTGYETISDNKTSVGMDRTDDIKKGTYQVLKIGSVAKFPKPARWHIAVGLISNIHAVQHYGDYLDSIADVMWTKTDGKLYHRAADLPPDASVVNLFDGIIAFTSSELRDEWLKEIFVFGKKR